MNFATDSIYAGKSVFLTGHTGFKGSWLALWLAHLGAKVTGYALEPPTDPSHFEVAKVIDCLDGHYVADIRDKDALAAAMNDAQPDIVFHLAAQSVVRTSYEIPRETYDVNVIGSIGVMDAVRQLEKPPAVVMVTSDKCYENIEQVWGYREDDALGEHDPYGGSKGAAEIAIRSYRHSFLPPQEISLHGVRLASARAGNVIGGGDWTKDALMVDVVHALSKSEVIQLRSPKALRPWQHVFQCLSGYLTLGARLQSEEAEKFCSGWNIGPAPGNEIPVQKVVDHFISHWGHGESCDVSKPSAMAEANILRLCIDKAIWELDWRPLWDVHRTLEKTAQWFRAYLDGEEMLETSLFQIQEYEDDLSAQVHSNASVCQTHE